MHGIVRGSWRGRQSSISRTAWVWGWEEGAFIMFFKVLCVQNYYITFVDQGVIHILLTSKAMVVRLSGMTKKPYAHAYKSLECVLGEQKSYSIRDLAVQFGCLEAVKHAENLLQRYRVACCKPEGFAVQGMGRGQDDYHPLGSLS